LNSTPVGKQGRGGGNVVGVEHVAAAIHGSCQIEEVVIVVQNDFLIDLLNANSYASILGSEMCVRGGGRKIDGGFSVEMNAVMDTLKSETKRKRCECCTRKLILADIACGKCNLRYCSQHRLPEDHTCKFDFQEDGRIQLAKANQRVVADKLERV